MNGDMVILNSDAIERYRRKNVLGKVELYQKLDIHAQTGANMLRGRPVNFFIAKKVAAVMGVKLTSLIRSWEKQQAS
jgi:hypothetical protein